MGRLTQIIVGTVVGGLIAAVGAEVCAGQTETVEQPLTSVQGKVVKETGGIGIRKVIVELKGINEDPSQDYETATDAAGVFKIEAVEPGDYSIEVRREGYFAVNPKALEATITVEAGKDVTGLVYKMQAAGAIAGKIVDADGDPVPYVGVTATRVGKRGARAVLRGAAEEGSQETNDLGEFRIGYLRAGQYEVKAQAQASEAPAPNPADMGKQKNRAVYTLTYYPGTVEQKQASLVRVLAGGTAKANFILLTGQAYRVNGAVGGVENAKTAQIVLMAKNGEEESQNLREGGQFDFPKVLPGTYVARVVEVSTGAVPGAPTVRMKTVSTPIVVSNADVTGLQLESESGGTVSGKLREESDELLPWREMQVSLMPVAEAGEEIPAVEQGMLAAITSVKDDGSFEIKEVAAGNYQLGVSGRSEKLRDYYTKSVQQNGREMVETGFTASGETTLEVVVSAKGASIEGTVLDSNGHVVATATVVSLPSSGKLGQLDSYQTEHTDERGHFVMRGLNPGQYVVLALENLPEDSRKPEFFEKYGEKGEKVELQEGERKSVGLTLLVEGGAE